MASWKRDFASGLIVLAPLLVTLFILLWIYRQIAGVPVGPADPRLRVAVTILVFVLLVFAVGYLMRTTVGAVLESTLDDLMNQLPGLRVVYNASKMAVETALGGTDSLQAPVKLDTWDGLRMTAFKTGKTTADGREILFLPTAPNITTGFVIEVEPERFEEVDESVEDALTRILSAGFGDTNDESLVADLAGAPAESGDDETAKSGDDETAESGDDETAESGDDEPADD